MNTFSVKNMGISALRNHVKGSKHQAAQRSQQQTTFPVLAKFDNIRNERTIEQQHDKEDASQSSTRVLEQATDVDGDLEDAPMKTLEKVSTLVPVAKSVAQVNLFLNHQLSNAAAEAEIRWCLKLVSSHLSMNSCVDLSDLLKMMFPDSSIAKKISLGKDKVSYIITFGLAPYFKDCLTQRVKRKKDFFQFRRSVQFSVQQKPLRCSYILFLR